MVQIRVKLKVLQAQFKCLPLIDLESNVWPRFAVSYQNLSSVDRAADVMTRVVGTIRYFL